MGRPGVLAPLPVFTGSMRLAISLRASRRASGTVISSALPIRA